MFDIRNINDTERLYWIRLARCEGIGPKTFFDLLQVYGSVEAALAALPNILKRTKKDPLNICSLSVARKELDAVHKLGGKIITLVEPDYPELLRNIPDPPPVITVLGDISILSETLIAVVGSRKAAANSSKFTQLLSQDLCRAGYTIVSGLAIGIDSVAHNTAIENGGNTIAVLGSGADVVYPQKNRELYSKVKEQGVIVSEFPLGANPKPQNFYNRNRVISGLSLGVVVVEASLSSGSLVTAKKAMEQRRAVFSVPGFPLDSRFSGSNKLIKQDAFLTESAQDIIDVINNTKDQKTDLFDSGYYRLQLYNKITDAPLENEIGKIKAEIIAVLDSTPAGIEDIIKSTGFKLNTVLIALVELELEGKLERHFGNKVCLLYD
ncbi:DNA processing protein DprA [Rickettsiales bacterium]|nr:DNA processing protein DprA [Rickettsiales bacterium]